MFSVTVTATVTSTVTEYMDRVVTETVTFDAIRAGAKSVKHGITSFLTLVITLLGIIALGVLVYTLYSAFVYINGIVQEKIANQDRIRFSGNVIDLRVRKKSREENLESAREMAAKVWAAEHPQSKKID